MYRSLAIAAVLATVIQSAPVLGQDTAEAEAGHYGQSACAAFEPGDPMSLSVDRGYSVQTFRELRVTYQSHDREGLTVHAEGQDQTFYWRYVRSARIRCRLTEAQGSYAGTGALLGAAAGIFGGAAIGAAFAENADLGDRTAAALGAGVVGLVGTLIGFGIGSTKLRDRDWRRFPRPSETPGSLGLALEPGPDTRLRIGVRWRVRTP